MILLDSIRRSATATRPSGAAKAIQPAFDVLLGVVDDVLAIDLDDARAAKDILLRYETMSARDAVHVAVIKRNGIDRIMSFDRGFDAHPGIERVA